jgi:two-component system, cell cycle response regulator
MYKLFKRETVIGRGSDADLRLVDDGISRRHAVVTMDGDQVSVKDLGSVNGTFCNGSRLARPVELQDGDKISMGGTTVLKFTFQDDLEARFSNNLYESAVRDGLTRLYNRRFFDERLHAEIAFAIRHRKPLALLLLDVDHFKRVNDTRGHQVGDITLREIAQRLFGAVRDGDIVARFGGEELAILCRDTDEAEGLSIANHLRSLVATEIPLSDEPALLVTVSVGIAVAPRASVSSEAELVKAADSALYAAKWTGRDRAVVFGAE